MKISLVISEGYKQVMFTPETDHEKEALKMIAPDDKLIGVAKWGTFTDGKPSDFGMNVSMSKAGYLRQFAEAESLMFVIEPKRSSDETPD